MPKAIAISIDAAFSQLKFLANRTPETTEEEAEDAFAMLSEYRDGGVFIGHYAGDSEWERHANGDEIVFVIQKLTVLVKITDRKLTLFDRTLRRFNTS